jgi:translocation and assembly module TamB
MPAGDAPPPPPRVVKRRRGWLRYVLGLPLMLLAVLVGAVLMLDTAIGHRLLVDLIADQEMKSGMRVRIGRIDGSVFRRARLLDVELRDTKGVFLKLPDVALDWRPLAWFSRGLDIREVTSRRGVLLRQPLFKVTEPSTSVLPDLDIRIDKLGIERLTLARAMLGEERSFDLHGRVELRRRHALVAADGRVSGLDHLQLRLDADEAGDRFALAMDLVAPKKGLVAALTGTREDRRLRLGGRGKWHDWHGSLLGEQAGSRVAALALTNRSGMFGVLGQVVTTRVAAPAASRLLGATVNVAGHGRLDRRVLSGRIDLVSAASRWSADGAVDLGADQTFHAMKLAGRVIDPRALGPGTEARGLHVEARLDGPLKEVTAHVTLAADVFASGTTRFEGVRAASDLRRVGAAASAPVSLTVARVVTGNAMIDPQLVKGHAQARFVLAGGALSSDRIQIGFPTLSADLALRREPGARGYALTGPVNARGLALANLGRADARAQMALRLPDRGGWGLDAKLSGVMRRIDNATLANLAGEPLRFAASVRTGSGQPILVPHATLDGSLLNLALSGRTSADGRATLAGSGHHASYGAFTVSAEIQHDGPHATLVFADPLPAAGIKDMVVTLAPIPQGFAIDVNGGSRLGPFAGRLGLYLPAQDVAHIAIEQFHVSDTQVTGAIELQPAGPQGTLTLHGGGVDGTLAMAPKHGGQALDLALALRDAHFGGDQPINVGEGRIEAHGLLAKGHTTLTGNVYAAGVGTGRMFLGRLAARASLTDGRGEFTAALAGRRGSRFDLQVLGEIAPDRLAAAASGSFAGQAIRMPRRAVFTAEAGGWRLAPSEIDIAGGKTIASGQYGQGSIEVDLALAQMPLSLSDVLVADMGLGGSASGTFHYAKPREGLPSADVRLLVHRLTRSGLVVTSRPIDLAVVAHLTPTALDARAVASEDGQARGKLQARLADLAPVGTLGARLSHAPLFAQLRYDGPADAIWRLMAIDTFDLTGPLGVAADIGGTLDQPRIRGSLSGKALRLQSALTGTDVSNITLAGGFNGSELTIASLSGTTSGNGQVAGSGTVRFAGLAPGKGPGIDIKLGARNAMLLSKPDLALAATGPIRILSDGSLGTIAGRLHIESARWRLGQSAAAAALPDIPTREINRGADIAPASERTMPWRFLIDASGPNRIRVAGLGIDSEWGADLHLRGTVDAPAIAGRAVLVTGTYEFAGKRFDLTRGRLNFDGNSPPDPRLDIAATTSVNGLSATVTVGGTSLKPEISFSSIPALPEEELLSRLLFGDSITQISPTEALQLGTALASLRGGGGMDPINKLRSAIGLDRLRIVNADPTQNRQTGVAAGKYLGRHFYAEIVTDGRGYSATNLEFRMTGWLSLLGSVSTVGRQSVNAKVSKDY